MDLTTVGRVKTQLQKSGTVSDDLITQLIPGVSAQIEGYLRRHTEQKERAELHSIDHLENKIFLNGTPVLATPEAVVKNDDDRVFDADTIVDADEYVLNLNTGLIEFDEHIPETGEDVIEVTYTGGMASSTTAFIAAFPDVAMATDLQLAYLFQRLDNIGLSTFSGEGANVVQQEPTQLLKAVKQILDLRRRKVPGGPPS